MLFRSIPTYLFSSFVQIIYNYIYLPAVSLPEKSNFRDI